jgi:hypothetical protein
MRFRITVNTVLARRGIVVLGIKWELGTESTVVGGDYSALRRVGDTGVEKVGIGVEVQRALCAGRGTGFEVKEADVALRVFFAPTCTTRGFCEIHFLGMERGDGINRHYCAIFSMRARSI